MQSFVNGVTIWAFNVLPALFPFMVLTTLTLKLQTSNKKSITKILFGVRCDNALLTSLLCGYPVGAKVIADSNADSDTATAMCSFCSTAGPIFMIATVGTQLLQSPTATAIIVATQILSALLNGLLYRPKMNEFKIEHEAKFSAQDIGDTITDSALSVISVGGLIALFYMLTDMIKSLLPQKIACSIGAAFVMGLFEMTNGLFGVCSSADIATATVLCNTLLAFGGLCVFAQCYAFLGAKQVNAFKLIKMKITQSAIATILSFALVKVMLI